MLVEVLIIQRWGRGYSPPFDFHPRLKDCGRAWRHTEGWIGRRMAHKPRRRRRGAIEMSDPMKLVGHARSEEHTSELQSLMRNSYAAFCLKKKINTYDSIYTIQQHNRYYH